MAFLSKRAKKFWTFLSVTAAAAVLLVVLFFGAVGWFFGRSPAREFETLKRSIDVQLLQSWAVQTLQQFPNPTNGVFVTPEVSGHAGRLVFSNTPAFLNRLPTFGALGPEVVISGVDAMGERHVELVYFSGGWGNGQKILAGSPGFALSTNSRCFSWVPGVYYQVW
jgi:hypothetical protein